MLLVAVTVACGARTTVEVELADAAGTPFDGGIACTRPAPRFTRFEYVASSTGWGYSVRTVSIDTSCAGTVAVIEGAEPETTREFRLSSDACGRLHAIVDCFERLETLRPCGSFDGSYTATVHNAAGVSAGCVSSAWEINRAINELFPRR